MKFRPHRGEELASDCCNAPTYDLEEGRDSEYLGCSKCGQACQLQEKAAGRPVKFRPHRALLEESMAEAVELAPTRQALADHYNATVKIGPEICAAQISVKSYYGMDARIGWDTYLVTAPGFGVLGFTDGPVEEE